MTAKTLTTEAGKRLLERESLNSRSFALITPDAVADIEDEARADLLAQIEKAVLRLPIYGYSNDPMDGEYEDALDRGAVLAAIRSAAPVEPVLYDRSPALLSPWEPE